MLGCVDGDCLTSDGSELWEGDVEGNCEIDGPFTADGEAEMEG